MNAKIGRIITSLKPKEAFEISEEEALDLALNNNKGIVEITVDEEEY